MKKALISLLSALCLLPSCTPSRQPYLTALDKAIENQPYYDLRQTHLEDSLRLLYQHAATDSAKWEAAYQLEKRLNYRDIDSCYISVKEMLRLCGNDRRQRHISEAAYANILYKMDSLQSALHFFRQIDTAGMTGDPLDLYCFAGYHIYGKLSHMQPEFNAEKKAVSEKWWRADSTRIECAYYHNEILRQDGVPYDALATLHACTLVSPNDTAKANYFIAREHLYEGDEQNAIAYFAKSAACDMRLSAKAYNSLYELARILFRTGDIERADRYMRITLKDAYSSHYESRYDDVIRSEMEIMNVLLEQQRQKRRAYLATTVAVALLLLVAVISLLLLTRYSSRLDLSHRQLSEASKIKDSFLADYMERCVDYLNKVDEYRSSLRHASKQGGSEAVNAMLRRPSFADSEFDGLLTHFDSAFLGIFPDFVEKVNTLMQPEHRLEMPSEGELSTELRILALIRMGIGKRQKIAKVLNMSVTTVYSYHSILQKHSVCPDASFDKAVAAL
jgi:hypothetical protein